MPDEPSIQRPSPRPRSSTLQNASTTTLRLHCSIYPLIIDRFLCSARTPSNTPETGVLPGPDRDGAVRFVTEAHRVIARSLRRSAHLVARPPEGRGEQANKPTTPLRPAKPSERRPRPKKMPSSGFSPEAGHKLWQRPTLAQARQALPSALWRFTSVFGMGTGGTTTQRSPDDGNLRSQSQITRCLAARILQRTIGTLIPSPPWLSATPTRFDNRILGQTPQLQRSESA